MSSKVKVVADATTKAVVNVSTNPEYGYIRIEQSRTLVDDNGFLRRKVVSALVPGILSELQAEGYYEGQELQGSIVIRESLSPFNEKTPEKDLKVAGSTGIICKLQGAPIYRKTVYSLMSNAEDTLIKHDNVEELRVAYAMENGKSTAIKANQDFSID